MALDFKGRACSSEQRRLELASLERRDDLREQIEIARRFADLMNDRHHAYASRKKEGAFCDCDRNQRAPRVDVDEPRSDPPQEDDSRRDSEHEPKNPHPDWRGIRGRARPGSESLRIDARAEVIAENRKPLAKIEHRTQFVDRCMP